MLKVKLWKHQQQMHDFIVEQMRLREYAWLLAGCATGKTLTSIQAMLTLGCKKVLVLTTKAGIRSAWVNDITRHTEGVRVVPLLKGSTAEKAKQMLSENYDEPTFYVVNYESAMRMVQFIVKKNFDGVIADESHRLKSHDSAQSQKLALACANISYRLAMTGTGWNDRPLDVFGQVRWLEPALKGRVVSSAVFGNYYQFFEGYAQYYSPDGKIKFVKGYKNLDRLLERIQDFTFFVDSEEVLDLPEFMDIRREIEMPNKLAAHYIELRDELMTEIDGDVITVPNVLAKMMKLHQLTGGVLDEYVVDDSKLMELDSIIEEIDDKPIVVFTRFTADVNRIYDYFTEKGYIVKKLVGGTHEHVEWQNGDGQILVCNIQAGSESVNLNRARYCVYYSKGFSRAQYDQSRYRVRRPGSSEPITYWHLCMTGTIDDAIETALKQKGDVSDLLIKGLQNRTVMI